MIVRLQGKELVFHHQVQGNRLQQGLIGLKATQVHKLKVVTCCQFPARSSSVWLCNWTSSAILHLRKHQAPCDSVLSHLGVKREERQIERNQDKSHDDRHGGDHKRIDQRHQRRKINVHILFVKFGDALEHGRQGAGGLSDFDHIQGG